MFASPNASHHQHPQSSISPASTTSLRRRQATNPLLDQYPNNNRATTPPPSSSNALSSRVNNQHNRPSQISFAGFGHDEKFTPGKSSNPVGSKRTATNSSSDDRSVPNESYLGVPPPPPPSSTTAAEYDQQQQQRNVQNRSPEANHFQDGDLHEQQQQHDDHYYYYHHYDYATSPQQNRQNEMERGSPEYLQQYYEDDQKLQKCFQCDIRAAQPLFSAKQIATRHLHSGFQLFAGSSKDAVLYTDRMLQLPPKRAASSSVTATTSARGVSSPLPAARNASSSVASVVAAVPEASASPVVVDYHDDVGHGKRTMRALLLERKQQDRDSARAFVERNGISILGRMQHEQAAGSATDALPGLMNRKNRTASPSSSHTHIKGMGIVQDCDADGSRFRYQRKMHADQMHESNLTRALLPIRKIKTPCANVLASPPRSPKAAVTRVGIKYSIDTNRVLCPDMIPESKQPRLRSLRPPEMLGQGMEIKEGAPQWTWKGGLRGDFWKKANASDPFGGEP